MSNEEKLISLLQPKDYKSKIKRYCNDCKVNNLVNKFCSLDNSTYICRQIIIKSKDE